MELVTEDCAERLWINPREPNVGFWEIQHLFLKGKDENVSKKSWHDSVATSKGFCLNLKVVTSVIKVNTAQF